MSVPSSPIDTTVPSPLAWMAITRALCMLAMVIALLPCVSDQNIREPSSAPAKRPRSFRYKQRLAGVTSATRMMHSAAGLPDAMEALCTRTEPVSL